ncbi:MAG: hypothetical protein HC822_10445 [Oscillochloris sp.]|nr:hypothetical protein [Oscillochloris sp.]
MKDVLCPRLLALGVIPAFRSKGSAGAELRPPLADAPALAGSAQGCPQFGVLDDGYVLTNAHLVDAASAPPAPPAPLAATSEPVPTPVSAPVAAVPDLTPGLVARADPGPFPGGHAGMIALADPAPLPAPLNLIVDNLRLLEHP